MPWIAATLGKDIGQTWSRKAQFQWSKGQSWNNSAQSCSRTPPVLQQCSRWMPICLTGKNPCFRRCWKRFRSSSAVFWWLNPRNLSHWLGLARICFRTWTPSTWVPLCQGCSAFPKTLKHWLSLQKCRRLKQRRPKQSLWRRSNLWPSSSQWPAWRTSLRWSFQVFKRWKRLWRCVVTHWCLSTVPVKVKNPSMSMLSTGCGVVCMRSTRLGGNTSRVSLDPPNFRIANIA